MERIITQIMKWQLLPLILISLLLSGCQQDQQPTIITETDNKLTEVDGPGPIEELNVKEAEAVYNMEFLNMVNVLTEIKAGRGELLAKNIEASLPAYLEHISTFEETDQKALSFYMAQHYYKKYEILPPPELEEMLLIYWAKAAKLISPDCYEYKLLCREAGCVPLPTSLRPVDTSAPNPSGFHYIIGSKCGFHWPKFWKMKCGAPLNGPACQ